MEALFCTIVMQNPIFIEHYDIMTKRFPCH